MRLYALNKSLRFGYDRVLLTSYGQVINRILETYARDDKTAEKNTKAMTSAQTWSTLSLEGQDTSGWITLVGDTFTTNKWLAERVSKIFLGLFSTSWDLIERAIRFSHFKSWHTIRCCWGIYTLYIFLSQGPTFMKRDMASRAMATKIIVEVLWVAWTPPLKVQPYSIRAAAVMVIALYTMRAMHDRGILPRFESIPAHCPQQTTVLTVVCVHDRNT